MLPAFSPWLYLWPPCWVSPLLYLGLQKVISGSEDFWTCSIHQDGHLNFLLLHKRHFFLCIMFYNVQSFRFHKITFLTFHIAVASISSAFSLASCSVKAVMCLVCHCGSTVLKAGQDEAGAIRGSSWCPKGQTEEVAERNAAKVLAASSIYDRRFWLCNFLAFLMSIYVILCSISVGSFWNIRFYSFTMHWYVFRKCFSSWFVGILFWFLFFFFL